MGPHKRAQPFVCLTASVIALSFLLFFWPSFGTGVSYDRSKLASRDHYIGLNGDVSSLPLWCNTCAIIGTSSHLLEREYGKAIDNYSCIFRIGFSPNRGFKKYVGSRTTARIVDSFRFFPFLKRPWKLATGPFKSEMWILFDRSPGDISWFHRPLLSDFVEKHDSKFLWMTKKAELQIRDFLKAKMSSISVPSTSALWFAIKVAEDAGCSAVSTYGVPDHQMCKRNMNVTERSFYWENSSVPLCMNGLDSSMLPTQSLAPSASLPTTLERKILSGWKPGSFSSFTFHAPEWPP